MSSHIHSIDVDVPVRTAYNQWTQFEEFPQFMDGVEKIIQLDDTHTRWSVNIGGVARSFDATITEQHPDERVAWTTTDGQDQGGVVTFHRLTQDTTRVTLQLDYEPSGFVETAGDKLGVIDRMLHNDLGRFKAFIEDRGAATGAWRGDIAPDDNLPSAAAKVPDLAS